MPRVSVVTPSYNHANFLPQRISSIRSQTMRDFEWVVIDDGSQDDSAQLWTKAAEEDGRIRLILRRENRGMAETVREAIAASSSDYIYRAESDDWCKPTLLATLLEPFGDSSVGLTYCATRRIDTNGRVTGGYRQPYRASVHDGKKLFRRLILRNFIAGPSIMFSREACDTAGGFAVDPFSVACDYHFTLRVCFSHRIAYQPGRLSYHRGHDLNLSGELGRTFDWQAFERESFLLIDDVIHRAPPEWGDLAVLRVLAYESIGMQQGFRLQAAAESAGNYAAAAAIRGVIERYAVGLTSSRAWRHRELMARFRRVLVASPSSTTTREGRSRRRHS